MKKLLTAIFPVKLGLLFVLTLCAVTVQAQSFKLTGLITDKADGRPLQGVTVVVKGERRPILTDNAGKFETTVSPGQVIQFSFVGYQTIEVPVRSGQADLQVAL